MMKFLASLALLAIVVSAEGYYYEQPDYPCIFKLTVRNSTNPYSSTEYKIYGRYTYKKVPSGYSSSYVFTRPDFNQTAPGPAGALQMAWIAATRQKCSETFVDMDNTVNEWRQNISDLTSKYSGKTYKHKEQKIVSGLTCDCYYDDDINQEAIYVHENYIYRIHAYNSDLTLTYSEQVTMNDFKISKKDFQSCDSKFNVAPPVDLAHCPSNSSSGSSSSSQVPAQSSSSSSSSSIPAKSSSSSSSIPAKSSSSSIPAKSSSSHATSSSSHTPATSSSSSGVHSYVQPAFPCAFELTMTTESAGSSNVIELKSFGRFFYERVGIITTVSRPDIHKTVDGTDMMGIFSTWTGDCTMTYGETDRKVESFLSTVAEYSAPYNNKKYNFKETKMIDNKTCDCYYDRDPKVEAVYVYEDFIYRIHTKNNDIIFDYSWSEPKMSDFKFDKDESPECEDYDDKIFSTPSKDYSNCGTPVTPSVSSLNSSARAEAMIFAVIAAIATSLVALF